MVTAIRNAALSLLSLLLIAGCAPGAPEPASTLIVNAAVYDGTGSAAANVAVRIDGDRIVAVGDLAPLDGERVVDTGGLVLAPGFIDTHSHHDSGMAEHRDMVAVLSQGVTTIVRGADGFSDVGREFDYLPLADFVANFESAPAAVNVASYAPHNSIRRAVMGDDVAREATRRETGDMAILLVGEMKAGALGLATGLEYEPGMYASTGELVELAKFAARFGGRYMSHLRDEDDRFEEAVGEIIRIGRESGVPVHISHIKLADRAAWGTTARILAVLDAARADGIEITADIYPYEHWASNLGVFFPDRDFDDREAAAFAFEHSAAPADIVLTEFAPNPGYAGMSIADIAASEARDAASVLMELARAADAYTRANGRSGSWVVARGMDGDDVAALLRWPHTNVCTDGQHRDFHPRGYGAFPRVLGRLVREQQVLTLAEALRKMTTLPAATLGLANRGRIAPGYFADLVLFDPDSITDRATMEQPTLLSTGVRSVWVNGALAFDDGAPTGTYPGRILRRAE